MRMLEKGVSDMISMTVKEPREDSTTAGRKLNNLKPRSASLAMLVSRLFLTWSEKKVLNPGHYSSGNAPERRDRGQNCSEGFALDACRIRFVPLSPFAME